jgi:hypothetical protein
VATVAPQLSMMIKTLKVSDLKEHLSAAPAATSGMVPRFHAAASKVLAQHSGWSAAPAESLLNTPRCRSAAGRGASDHGNGVELLILA